MKFASVAATAASVVLLASTAAAQQEDADVSHALSFPEYLAKAELANRMESDFKPLILGGTEVPIGQKTYVSGLRTTAGGRDFCGGSLITPKHILTAAHCYGSIKYVSVGTHYLSGTSDGVQVAVTKQTRHPSYNGNTNSYDFLILELASPVTKYAPVALATKTPAPGTTTTVAGWGTTSSGGTQSNVLLQVDVPVVADATCKAKLSIDETMLCAGGARNKDSCQGDSGGPLTAKVGGADAQVGVVSWGEGCGLQGYPGVYSRISIAKSWINSVVSAAGQSVKWV